MYFIFYVKLLLKIIILSMYKKNLVFEIKIRILINFKIRIWNKCTFNEYNLGDL